MPRLKRTVITLELYVDSSEWQSVEDLLQPLRAVPGVERLDIKEKLALTCWLSVELHLAATDKPKLRRIYNRVSKLASQQPLRLGSRTCRLADLF